MRKNIKFFEKGKDVLVRVIRFSSKKPQFMGALLLLISAILFASSELDMNRGRLVSLGLAGTDCDIAFESPGFQWNIHTTYGRITETDCHDIVNRSRAAYKSAELKKSFLPIFGISGLALLFVWWKRRPVAPKRINLVEGNSKVVEPDSAKLASLESLLANGILTDDEFKAAKKRLL